MRADRHYITVVHFFFGYQAYVNLVGGGDGHAQKQSSGITFGYAPSASAVAVAWLGDKGKRGHFSTTQRELQLSSVSKYFPCGRSHPETIHWPGLRDEIDRGVWLPLKRDPADFASRHVRRGDSVLPGPLRNILFALKRRRLVHRKHGRILDLML